MKIEYENESGTLWLVVGEMRYLISQLSGELKANDEHDISDYYWGGGAEEVKRVFEKIADIEL